MNQKPKIKTFFKIRGFKSFPDHCNKQHSNYVSCLINYNLKIELRILNAKDYSVYSNVKLVCFNQIGTVSNILIYFPFVDFASPESIVCF